MSNYVTKYNYNFKDLWLIKYNNIDVTTIHNWCRSIVITLEWILT